MKTFIRGILAALLLAAAFAATSPTNRLEAEDAYEYAWRVDTAASLLDPQLWHPHHLIYLPGVRALHSALQSAGIPVRAYPLMCALSALAAAWAVICAFQIMRMAGASRKWATVIASGLAVSYGWWRYAFEAEVYAPAAALSITAVLLAFRSEAKTDSTRTGKKGLTASLLLGAVAALVHVQAGIAGLIAIPVFLWRAGRFKDAVRYALVCGSLIAVVYGAAITGHAWAADEAHGDMGRRERSDITKMPVKAVIGQGQALISGNFIFSYATARDRLQHMFPYRMLDEEMQMGRATPGWVKATAPITLAGLFIFGAALIFLRVRASRREAAPHMFTEPMSANAMRWSAAAWFICTASIAALFEPANPEMWILALPPLAVGVGLWIATGYSSSTSPKNPIFTAACASVVFLFLHNMIGGWVPLSTKDGDYARTRSDAALAALRPGDLLLTGDGPVMFRWLRYHAPFGAQVESALLWPADQRDLGYERMRTMLRQSEGRMIILPDVIAPPRGLEGRFGEQVRSLRAWAKQHEAEWLPSSDIPGAWIASLVPPANTETIAP